mgnify:CR=1 FL=1
MDVSKWPWLSAPIRHEAGAPKPVVKDMAKLMSLDYAPFDLAYGRL